VDRQIVHIVDDDVAVRHSLCLLLMTRGFKYRGYANARLFLEAIDTHESGCVVTDVRMPDITGVELLAELAKRRLNLPVIVMTAYAEVALAMQVMKLGAIDLIEKPIDDEVFVASIQRALASDSIGRPPKAQAQCIRSKLDTLTAQERAVLMRLLDGKSNQMIGVDLGISVKIVEIHRANVMSKLGAKSLTELVRMSLIAFGGPKFETG
jgi:two-component system response regulator FixJ